MDLIEALVANGKYNWQAFGAEDGVGSGPSSGPSCATWMRTMCDPAKQGEPMAIGFDAGNVNQSVAAFLVTRCVYAVFS